MRGDLFVSVDDPTEAPPGLDTDESYNLSVPVEGAATLSARTVYGALRGLETFSQLIAAGHQKVEPEIFGICMDEFSSACCAASCAAGCRLLLRRAAGSALRSPAAAARLRPAATCSCIAA